MGPVGSRFVRRVGLVLGLSVIVTLTPQLANAQDNEGSISGTVGVDAGHAYFFRGILQEREGLIAQPYGDVTVQFADGSDGPVGVALTIGQWNSLHSGPTGADGNAANTKMWYESDAFAGVTLGFDNFEAGVTYTSYLSPNDSFGTVKELSFGLSMDDSELLGAFAMSPHVLVAMELDGQADGGTSEGAYLQLGVEPAYGILDDRMGVGFPVTVGLSLQDYYEDGDTFDDGFGFFEVGAIVTAPVEVPAGYGSWELHGGFRVLTLGDYLRAINDGDRYQPVAVFGLSIGY